MSTKDEIKDAMSEMHFEIVDNGVLELPTSKPAVFAVDGDADPDVDALEDELDEHGFGLMEDLTETREDGRFYCHFDVFTDHYKRVRVKTLNDTVRIFPDEETPDTYEFVRIVHAIEDAFGCELRHTPENEE